MKVAEYVVATAILIVIGVFYWYSRNIVCGYYELLWFRNVAYSSITTKFFLIIPAIIYVVAIVVGIINWRKKKLNV